MAQKNTVRQNTPKQGGKKVRTAEEVRRWTKKRRRSQASPWSTTLWTVMKPARFGGTNTNRRALPPARHIISLSYHCMSYCHRQNVYTYKQGLTSTYKLVMRGLLQGGPKNPYESLKPQSPWAGCRLGYVTLCYCIVRLMILNCLMP